MKPKLLDLFCGAGGASMGYHRAGFEVYGIDHKPQSHYPFPFLQMDVLEAMDRLLKGEGLTFSNGKTLYLSDISAFHASPPCQRFSAAARLHRNADSHPDLLTPIRNKVSGLNKPYIIENVVGAPMIAAIMLCGSSFGLRVRRHRLFESNIQIWALPCSHHWQNKNPIWSIRQRYKTIKTGICYVFGNHEVGQTMEDWKLAMGIDWMVQDELNQAIPPAYTEYIGKYLLKVVR